MQLSLDGLLYNIEGLRVVISKKNIFFLSLKIIFVLENSADPDESPQHAAFHLGLKCLS